MCDSDTLCRYAPETIARLLKAFLKALKELYPQAKLTPTQHILIPFGDSDVNYLFVVQLPKATIYNLELCKYATENDARFTELFNPSSETIEQNFVHEPIIVNFIIHTLSNHYEQKESFDIPLSIKNVRSMIERTVTHS